LAGSARRQQWVSRLKYVLFHLSSWWMRVLTPKYLNLFFWTNVLNKRLQFSACNERIFSLSLFLSFSISLFSFLQDVTAPKTKYEDVLYPTAPFYSATDFIMLLNGKELKPSYSIDDDVSFIRYNCVLSFLSFLSFLTFLSFFFSGVVLFIVIFYILYFILPA
jgi:hypothetical protein